LRCKAQLDASAVANGVGCVHRHAAGVRATFLLTQRLALLATFPHAAQRDVVQGSAVEHAVHGTFLHAKWLALEAERIESGAFRF